MDFHPEDVIISLINIVVLFILLRLILWKHVVRFLAKRAARVRSEMDDVEKQRNEAKALNEEYDKKIGDIEAQGRDMIRESREKANAESERIINETRERAKEIITEAEARIAEEKEQAIADARLEVTQLATDMAARILDREVSAADTKHVVDEFFKG